MEIRIAIRTTEPLTGTATAEGEEPRDFEGWLELLHSLSTLVGTGGELSEDGATDSPLRRHDER